MKENLFSDFDNRGYGGKRAGSGRKATGRRKVQLWISPDEEAYLRKYLDALRSTDRSHFDNILSSLRIDSLNNVHT